MTTDATARLAALMDQAYLEVIPTRTIVDRLVHIPRHSYVAITCSPAAGIDATLDMVDELRALPEERQLKLVPHMAARMVRDRIHLSDIVQRLDAATVEWEIVNRPRDVAVKARRDGNTISVKGK